MEIRSERPEDVEAIREVATVAFRDHPHSRQTEAAIIDGLRQANALSVSLVAVLDGTVVGHVAFSPVAIDGEGSGWFGLGPVCVLPEFQRQGIGQALIREGLARLGRMNARGCVLVGDPDYYGRFGFITDPALRCGDVPAEYLQRLVLGRTVPRGEVRFHPAFDAA